MTTGRHLDVLTPFRSELCAACGVTFRLPKTPCHICGNCNRSFCSACYMEKLSMELEDGDVTPDSDMPSQKGCVTCEQVVQRKRRNSKKVGSVLNNTWSSSRSTVNTSEVPSYPRDATFSAAAPLAQAVPSVNHSNESKVLAPFRQETAKRNNRGLASKTNILNVFDNRYEILNAAKKEWKELERAKSPVFRPNFEAFSVKKKNPDQLKFTSQQSSIQDDGFGDPRRRQQNTKKSPTQAVAKDVSQLQHYPWDDPQADIDQRQYYSQGNSRISQSSRKEFRQSQYNTRIGFEGRQTYLGASPDHRKQTFAESSEQNHGQLNSGRWQDDYTESLAQSTPEALEEFYDDPYINAENVEELEGALAFDEIPYILTLAGLVDKTTLRKAIRKQNQRVAFETATRLSKESSHDSKMPRNKNTTEVSGIVDTYPQQVNANRVLENHGETNQTVNTGNDNNVSMPSNIKPTEGDVSLPMRKNEVKLKVQISVTRSRAEAQSDTHDTKRNPSPEHRVFSGQISGKADSVESTPPTKSEEDNEKFIREQRIRKLGAGHVSQASNPESTKTFGMTITGHTDKKAALVNPKAVNSDLPNIQINSQAMAPQTSSERKAHEGISRFGPSSVSLSKGDANRHSDEPAESSATAVVEEEGQNLVPTAMRLLRKDALVSKGKAQSNGMGPEKKSTDSLEGNKFSKNTMTPEKPTRNRNVNNKLDQEKTEDGSSALETKRSEDEKQSVLICSFGRQNSDEEARPRTAVVFLLSGKSGKCGIPGCENCGQADAQGNYMKSMSKMTTMAQKVGFQVRNVRLDGNCMFAAVVDQLEINGDHRFGAKSLREAAVSWLIEHPCNEYGEHFSSFVSEEWNAYIDRMMTEGEWGDHVTLRAIVEVIGRTISVLNMSGEDPSWTDVEPSNLDLSKDDRQSLVLGNVGEFHYVSLRPCENDTTPSGDDNPVREDGLSSPGESETHIESADKTHMFQDDYIDDASEMPVVHFSFLLKKVVPLKLLDEAKMISSTALAAEFCNPCQLLNGKEKIPSETEFCGSLVEDVFIPSLNAKISQDSADLENVTYLFAYVIRSDTIVTDNSESSDHNGRIRCITDTSGVHCGYTKILEFVGNFSRYLPHVPITRDTQRAPTVLWQGHLIKRMVFRSLKCSVWPSVADEWITRQRRSNWPTEEMILSVKAIGCVITETPHEKSKSPDIEWQFSFALAEKKLFRECISQDQRYCYILFNTLCSQATRSFDSLPVSPLKSIFLYACEDIPAETWEKNPGACVLYMLDELLRRVDKKNFPHYFIPGNNLIDHFNSWELQDIVERISLVRSQPVLFLRQIGESIQTLPSCSSVIDKICEDFQKYSSHKSLKTSTLDVFVPVTLEVSQNYAIRFRFPYAFEFQKEAFKLQSLFSTQNDPLSFRDFLKDAVSNLGLCSLVWFSAYIDLHLQTKNSKALTRELCEHLELIQLNKFLPEHVAGSFGGLEVPKRLTDDLCSFCHNFVRFLWSIDKVSEALPVLNYCHEVYEQTQRENHRFSGQDSTSMKADSMFFVYVAMFNVYSKLNQMDSFRPMLPAIEAVCHRINKNWAYACFLPICTLLKEDQKYRQIKSKCQLLPLDKDFQSKADMYDLWPYFSTA